MAKISELSYETISNQLGKETFCMHTAANDELQYVRNQYEFESVRERITKAFGDVELEINSHAHWFDQVLITDETWKKKQEEFLSAKAEWCSKYGCD